MTEKRFRAVVCVTDWYIEDKEISPFAVLTPHQSSDLLNELYEENMQLKEELKTKCIVNKQYEENQRLIKMLDNVANYMQKQYKNMPLDDFVEWWNKMATEGLE